MPPTPTCSLAERCSAGWLPAPNLRSVALLGQILEDQPPSFQPLPEGLGAAAPAIREQLTTTREIGYTANRRLLHVQRPGHDPITGIDALHAITDAVTTATGTRVPALRLADRRSHALLQALLIFRTHPNGFANGPDVPR